MDELRVCHCGKCKITCNKHGKISKCEECGKRRRLGTEVIGKKVRHICNQCCDVKLEQQQKEIDTQVDEVFKEMREQETAVKNLGIRMEEDERCVPVSIIGDTYEWM